MPRVRIKYETGPLTGCLFLPLMMLFGRKKKRRRKKRW